MTTAPDPQDTLQEFRQVMNMSAAALQEWLETDESRAVGMTANGQRVTEPAQAESVGHHMGQRIMELKRLPQAELAPDDYAAMRKVIGYVHRHLAQRPSGDIEGSRWRKSLMNWGHDPLL